MKKTKIKQRIKNATDAFFADETSDTNDFLSFRDEANFLQKKKIEDFARKYNTLETILKQVFLFFPGTLILYFLSFGFTALYVSLLVNPLGLIPRYWVSSLMTMFLAAILMTWLGLGDVRKLKHLVIPSSIITVGVIFGALVGGLITISHQFERFIFINSLPLYLLPLALVVPFLAKGWVDRNDKN